MRELSLMHILAKSEKKDSSNDVTRDRNGSDNFALCSKNDSFGASLLRVIGTDIFSDSKEKERERERERILQSMCKKL